MIRAEDIKNVARGRWVEIVTALGGIDPSLLDGRHHACPKCGGTDRFRMIDQQAGAVLCNQCFKKKNGDGIAAVQWLTGCNFKTAISRIADYLGITSSSDTQQTKDIVEAVARLKRVPVESLRAYGAHAAMRGRLPVCRIPVYNEKGERHSHFDIPGDGRKGWFAEGKGKSGIFLPDGKLPKPGERWLLVEGPKDAAALLHLNFLALGMPTCELPQKFVRLLAGVDVILVPDRDEAGVDGADKTARRLYGHAQSVRIAVLPTELKKSGGADVRDILCSG